MKTWILAAVMMMGLTVSAQEKRERPEPLKPEQRTELCVKKLALELDLNDKQQQDLKKLFLERSKDRAVSKAQFKANKEAGKKLSADERFAMQSKRLDGQIAMKKELKKILTPEQFEKLGKLKHDRNKKFTKRNKNFKKHQRR